MSGLLDSVAGFVLLGIAALCLLYMLPTAIRSRQMVADARIEDRFSTGLRVLARQAHEPARPDGEARVFLHANRADHPEAPMDSTPTLTTTPTAAAARRRAAVRAAHAAASSRRAAAARRRLAVLLLLAAGAAVLWTLFVTINLHLAAPIAVSAVFVLAAVAGRRAAVRAALADERELVAIRRAGGARGASEREARVEKRDDADKAAGGERRSPRPAAARPAAEDAPRQAGGEGSGSLRISVDPAGSDGAGPVIDQSEGWTPVPVPAPTYSLKAPAPRREVEPYEAPQWRPADAAEEREETLAEVEQSVREQRDPGAPQATPQQVLAEEEVARAEEQAARAEGESEHLEDAQAPASSLDLQAVLQRRRAAG